jgi:hypothetical protein
MVKMTNIRETTRILRPIIVFLILLLTCYPLNAVYAQTNNIQTFAPTDIFSVQNSNSSLNFAVGGSYTQLTEENGALNFYGLALNNYVLNFSNPRIDIVSGIIIGREVLNYSANNGDFSIKLKNCNVIIKNYDILANFVPRHGWLNYTVEGSGSQSFDLHYNKTIYQPLNWTVYVNNTMATSNFWSISSDSWLTIQNSEGNVSIYYHVIDSPKEEPKNAPFDLLSVGIIVLISVTVLAIILATLFLKYKKTLKNSNY